MSKAGIASIALLTPVVASNAVFSARRMSRGVDAMEENPLFALANLDIAAAQILKGGRAVKALTVATEPTAEIATKGAANVIKETGTASKLLKGAGKVIRFTADYINPVIVAAGAIKVAGSDDKLDAAARESTSLLCMFGAEAFAKDFVGMPFTEKINGKVVTKAREGSYKKLLDNVFSQKQKDAIQNFAKTKKGLAGGIKGLIFCGASIAGYQLGNMLANSILGERKESA